MGSISDFLENELLDHVFNVGSYSPPATVYLGLSTADPTDDASGLAEPSGNGYVRKAITFSGGTTRTIRQAADVTFDQATGSWGTLSHWGVFDAESAGNMLSHGQLGTSKAVVSGNTPSVSAPQIQISFNSGDVFNYLADRLLNFVFRNEEFSQPSNYIVLSTSSPDDDGTGVTEPSGNNYARKQHETWDPAASGATENSGEIQFNGPSGSWGTITDMAVFDAVSSGNPLVYGTVSNQAVTSGDTVKFTSGGVDITLS